jgi:hypothetical protein
MSFHIDILQLKTNPGNIDSRYPAYLLNDGGESTFPDLKQLK